MCSPRGLLFLRRRPCRPNTAGHFFFLRRGGISHVRELVFVGNDRSVRCLHCFSEFGLVLRGFICQHPQLVCFPARLGVLFCKAHPIVPHGWGALSLKNKKPRRGRGEAERGAKRGNAPTLFGFDPVRPLPGSRRARAARSRDPRRSRCSCGHRWHSPASCAACR